MVGLGVAVGTGVGAGVAVGTGVGVGVAVGTCVGAGVGLGVGGSSAPHPARARVTTSMVATSNHLYLAISFIRARFWRHGWTMFRVEIARDKQ